MAEYKIILDGLRSFGAEVIAPGNFTSVRGLPTEVAAREWLTKQQAIDAATGAHSHHTVTEHSAPGGQVSD